MGEEGSAMMASTAAPFQIDPDYEFSAPMYFDFCAEETGADAKTAERWFETAMSYEDSPKSKECAKFLNADDSCQFESNCLQEHMSYVSPVRLETTMQHQSLSQIARTSEAIEFCEANVQSAVPCEDEPHTPDNVNAHHELLAFVNGKPSCTNDPELTYLGSLPVKRLHSEAWKDLSNVSTASRSTVRALTRPTQASLLKMTKLGNKVLQPDDHAVKKQKLEGGRFHKILNVKERPSQTKTVTLTVPEEFHLCSDKRAQQHINETCSKSTKVERSASPFVSIAEKVHRFQMKTPERFRHHSIKNDEMLVANEKPKLKLTNPKEPEFETSHRVRLPKVKSRAELEDEMLAKIPKFKARPVNKKILEAPSLPALPKRAPQLPQFQEFHLRTMERALQHSGGPSSVCSSDSQSNSLPVFKQRRKSAPGGCLTEPREPCLETALRARPAKVKSTAELEEEELSKFPKFKARPFNKRIFESRGDLGIFRTEKRQVTTPSEFHFATDKRIDHQPPMLVEKLNKLCLNTRSDQEPALRATVPQPFHLVTEERGLIKEMRMMEDLIQTEMAEKEARIPKANPLPYTTDCPVIPPKPEPKACTKPQPFQLESVARHEEELHRKAQELAHIEQQEAESRNFKAQPVQFVGSVFVPERSRKPLTEVQEISLAVDTRASERAEFDRKLLEKQSQYKRFREELEAAREVEEERFIKALRKEMVPQARPMPLFGRAFVPQRSSKTPTRPLSPRLRTRKERRRSLTLSVQKRSQMR